MIKRLCLTIFCFIALIFKIEAQTEKGNWIFGGNSSLSISSNKITIETDSQELDGGTLFNISFSPAVGYFVTDDLALGIELPVSFEKSNVEDFDEVETENKTFAFIPSFFARYYFTTSTVRPYLQGGVGFGKSKTEFDSDFGSSDTNSNIFQYSLNGGIAIFLNSTVSLDLGVGYFNSTSSPEESDLEFQNSTVGFNVGFNFFLKSNNDE